MKNFLLTLIVCSLIGCTAPTQRVAEKSLEIGIRQENSIILDLINLNKQKAVNEAVRKAVSAAEANDLNAVQLAVEGLANEFQKVEELRVEHEKARQVLRIVQQYVWSQRGILDILLGEFQEAKSKAGGLNE